MKHTKGQIALYAFILSLAMVASFYGNGVHP